MASVINRNKWAVWRDVVFALFVREIRIGFNDKFGVGWAVVQPILFIFILSFIRGRLNGGETHSIPTFVFMAYGMIFIQAFLLTFNSCAGAIKKNKALMGFRQVQPISAVIAAAVFELLVKLFVFAGIFLVMFLLNMELHIADPLTIMLSIVVLWLFAMSLGLGFALAALYVPEVTKIQNMMTRPLFFISGVFFSLQDVPKEYWWLLDWNPILHAIELSRAAAYPSYSSEGVSLQYLLVVSLSILFLSLAMYQALWKQAISR